ncbi:endonuclease exonuclease phosphatase domain-containing, partial [Cystoisospora suis]
MNLSFHCSSSFSPDSLRADSEKQRSDLHSLKKTSFLGISVDSFGRGTSSSSSLFCPSSSLESRGSLLSLMSEESCCSPLSSSERKTRSLCYDETGVPDTLDVCRVYVHQGIEQHEDSNALRRNSPVKMIYITSSNRKTPPSHSTPPPPSEISCFPSSSSSSSPSEDLQLSPQHSSASSSVSSPFSSSPLVCNLPFSSSSSSPSFLRPPSSLLLPLAFLLLHSSSQLSPHPSSSFSSFSSSSSSFSLAVWLSRNLEGTLPSLTKASAKKVVGLSRGSIYEPIVDFCFTIPEGSKGQIKAQTMISSPGHELIILNRTESEALSIINNSPDFSSSSSSSSYYYSDRDHTICRRLIDNARVREPL